MCHPTVDVHDFLSLVKNKLRKEMKVFEENILGFFLRSTKSRMFSSKTFIYFLLKKEIHEYLGLCGGNSEVN